MGMVVDSYRFAAAGGDGSFRYYRWVITATSATDVQVDEFELLASSVVQSVSSASGFSQFGNTPDKLINGTTGGSSKWYSSVSGHTADPLVFDMGSSVTLDQYQWRLANDARERDPKDWTVAGSNDLSAWTTLDTVTGYTITGVPPALQGPFNLDEG